MKTFQWLVRREFWEHRGGFLWAPVGVAIAMLVLVALSLFASIGMHGSASLRVNGEQVSANDFVLPLDRIDQATGIAMTAVAAPILLVLAFVAFFFCVGALFDERKDRSILFWKSLPLTDSATVLAKVAMALVVAPLIALAVAAVTGWVFMLLVGLGSLVVGKPMLGSVLGSGPLYLAPLQWLSMLPVYALWALPTVGWLLMVSAWARSKPFIWAVGTPLVAGVLVSWSNALFGLGLDMSWLWKNIMGRGLLSIVPGSWMQYEAVTRPAESLFAGGSVGAIAWGAWQLPLTVGFWVGVVAGAAMIFAAIRIRRWKDEG